MLAPAQAQTDPLPAKAMAAGRELVTASRAADQFKAALPLILQQLKPMFAQGRPAVEKDFDAILPVLMDSVSARMTVLTDMFAVIYARNLTVAEMRDLAGFYRTPVGQKLLEKMPIILWDGMLAGQQFGRQISSDLQQRMVDELRKRGHDIKI